MDMMKSANMKSRSKTTGLVLLAIVAMACIGVVIYMQTRKKSTTTTTTTTRPSSTTSTTTTTTRAPTTTTTTSTTSGGSSVTTIKPATTGLSWTKVPYNFNATSGGTSNPQQGSETQNQQFTLNAGYNCYVYDGKDTIYPRYQGNSATGNTLITYKNGAYWTTPNTSVVFGPNTTSTFSQQTLGSVLSAIQNNTSMNMVLLNGNVTPTAAKSTLVSGTYSADAAMLNVSSDQSFYTWFYGGTTFPYSYTMTAFTPSAT